MPALVDSFFTVRQAAWHDPEGTNNYDRNPTSVDEALEWAGLTWEPVKSPVFHSKHSVACDSKDGCQLMAVATVNDKHFACGTHSNVAARNGHTVKPLPTKQLPEWYAVMRNDTGAVLDVSPHSRELFLNRQTYELLEMIVKANPLDDPNRNPDLPMPTEVDDDTPVQFETGGALKDGKLVWGLARLNLGYYIQGKNGAKDASPIFPYASILNSHDGSAALRAILTSIRIVCWNTWSAAESEASKTGKEFSFRHTASIHDRVEEAKQVLFRTRQSTEEWVQYANEMIAVPFRDDSMTKFLELYVPMPPAEAITDRVANNVLESRQQILSYYNSASCASIRDTAWGAIQAVGEFLDHGRDYRTKESYVSRTMLKPEKGKKKALSLIKELALA